MNDYRIHIVDARCCCRFLYATWSVSLSMFVCVSHDRELCKNGWTIWDAVWHMDLGALREYVLDGNTYRRHLVNIVESLVLGG